MIVFEGNISIKAAEHKSKYCDKVILVVETIVFVLCLLMIAYYYIRDHVWEKEFIFCAAVMLFTIIALCFSTTSKKRLTVFNQNVKIIIDNENITNINPFSTMKKPLSKIKKILDMGEWYYIIFKLGDITNSWICQKNLIKTGTIEEFEKLFENKIQRKK